MYSTVGSMFSIFSVVELVPTWLRFSLGLPYLKEQLLETLQDDQIDQGGT